MKLYALRIVSTGVFLGVDCIPYDIDHNVGVEFRFCESPIATMPVWMTTSKDIAQQAVLQRDIYYYNTCYDIPSCPNHLRNVTLEIVELL